MYKICPSSTGSFQMTSPVQLKFARLRSGASAPTKGTFFLLHPLLLHAHFRHLFAGSDGAAGVDLAAAEDRNVKGRSAAAIPTGLCFSFPEGNSKLEVSKLH